MNSPNRFLLLSALAACCLAPTLAQAGIVTGSTVSINETSPQNVAGADPSHYSTASTYGYSSGGEFLVQGAGESFKTFCLEYGETISLGGSYTASLDSGSINGGGISRGATDLVPGHAGLTMDPLSSITTFLYYAYLNSDLDGFDIGGAGAADNFRYGDGNWADALQLAIWRAEDELGSDYKRDGGATIGDLVVRKMADHLYDYALLNAGTGNSNVMVLNLWNGAAYNGTAAQSQLYYAGNFSESVIHHPEPASLLIWGGLGLAGLVAARRRQVRQAT